MIARNLVTGEYRAHAADAVALVHRRLRQRRSSSRRTPRPATSPRPGARTASAAPSSRTRATRRSTRPAFPSPGDYQSKLTLMSESLQKRRTRVGAEEIRRIRREVAANDIPEGRPRLLSRAPKYPSVRQPRAAGRRLAERRRPCATRGAVSARSEAWPSTWTSSRRDPAPRPRTAIREPATATCFRCTSGSPREDPYSGADEDLPGAFTTRWAASGWTTTSMSTIPGLYVLGEANFSDHGANRLGCERAHAGACRRLLRGCPTHDGGDYFAGRTIDRRTKVEHGPRRSSRRLKPTSASDLKPPA